MELSNSVAFALASCLGGARAKERQEMRATAGRKAGLVKRHKDMILKHD
jgi:hypothetical protein